MNETKQKRSSCIHARTFFLSLLFLAASLFCASRRSVCKEGRISQRFKFNGEWQRAVVIHGVGMQCNKGAEQSYMYILPWHLPTCHLFLWIHASSVQCKGHHEKARAELEHAMHVLVQQYPLSVLSSYTSSAQCIPSRHHQQGQGRHRKKHKSAGALCILLTVVHHRGWMDGWMDAAALPCHCPSPPNTNTSFWL